MLPTGYANQSLAPDFTTKVHEMSEKASDYFRRLQASMRGLEQQIVRDVIAVEAEDIHAENFKAEAFIDTTPDKWPARKKSDKDPKRRALLVKGTNLKTEALKGRTRNGAVEFVFPISKEYARVHNEGLKAGRGEGFKMPKRQFVGESKVLTDRITKKVQKLFDEHLKKL